MSARIRCVCTAALMATLSLGLTGARAAAQQRATSERRLVLPTGQISGLSGSYWTAALAGGGPAPRHERLLAVRPDGRVLAVIDGEPDRVMLSLPLLRDLSEQKLQATLVHNHPGSVGLGESDLSHLAKMGVCRIIAVDHEGTVYEAAAGARYEPAFAERLYPAIENRVRERLAVEAWRNREDPGALAQHVAHLVAAVLARAQVIDYLVTPGETTRLAFNRYHELFDRVVVAEGQHLEELLAESASQGKRQKAEGKKRAGQRL